MKAIHGGDIYRNRVKLDFSVNINPLGIPEGVRTALQEAVNCCMQYPDPEAQKLKAAVSQSLQVPTEALLFGNGASELFLAIVHGLKPKKILIPVPSFYGYEHAAGASGSEIVFYEMKKEQGFSLEDGFLEALTADVDLVFIANPNNPTGKRIDETLLLKVLKRCREKKIVAVLDECFIEFCGERFSLIHQTAAFDNLIVVRAYTKIFAIPGVRLGYLVCENAELRENIKGQLPEWNLSCFAQAAGCACAKESDFLVKTVRHVKAGRAFLAEGLGKAGIEVWESDADFLLIYSEKPLYERLLRKGILIRDCSNFRGLSKGYYRICVKTFRDHEKLLKAIGEIN